MLDRRFQVEWTDGRTVRVYDRREQTSYLFVLVGTRIICESGTYTPEALAAACAFLARHGLSFLRDT